MVERVEAQWWSVPQAIVWIVSGSESIVENVPPLITIASLNQLTLHPISAAERPPLSLNDARAELMLAARAEEIGISGQRPDGLRELIPESALKVSRLIDLNGLNECMPCIFKAKEPLQPDSGRHWLRLWIRKDECMRRWPAAPADQVQRDDAPKHPPRRRGRKPAQLNAAREYLQKQYGQHVPESIKLENLRDELKGAKILVSLRTLGRALGRE